MENIKFHDFEQVQYESEVKEILKKDIENLFNTANMPLDVYVNDITPERISGEVIESNCAIAKFCIHNLHPNRQVEYSIIATQFA
ncbi:hypothetical protein NMR56_003379 [Vibrio cholerae]|uniref:hypothetical protein n=1 Tax=Vibrio cholerae TaxID=666 RepID=UPI00053BC14F|nr:hypothetical protein [Vibrio cholerae]EJL6260858.1 hypothetical protein [Vibrio cholerae]EJL6659272.1 hypothetical protein [Vibrio cholerae]MDV2308462.1 hypothetical protein [Vibrio cholerae]TXZ03642.1 hypothetical protein FXE62_11115 [Vibrio cholerae]GHY24560.1 hypothetical protein VCSRO69_3646 [Vibrio cholerae]